MFAAIKNFIALVPLLVEALKGLKALIEYIDRQIRKIRRGKEIDKAVEKAKSTKDTSSLENITR
jgi:hypothetical protein